MAPGLKLCVNKSKNVKLSDTVENSDLITLSALKKKRNKKCLLTTPDCSSVANPSIGEITKERKTIKNKMRNDSVEHEYSPDPFNSILYEQKRLPIGLSMVTGGFALQKPKYAAKWL